MKTACRTSKLSIDAKLLWAALADMITIQAGRQAGRHSKTGGHKHQKLSAQVKALTDTQSHLDVVLSLKVADFLVHGLLRV